MLHNGLTKHEAKKGKEEERRRKEKKRKREWELCTVPIHPNKQDLLSFQTKTILLISWCFTSLVRHGALRLWYVIVFYVHINHNVCGVCVCGGGGVRAWVRACVCTLLLLSIFLVFERFLAPCFIEWLMFYVNFIECFYVNDERESKFLYTETIKLYCIV